MSEIRPEARRPKGFRDSFEQQALSRREMIDKICKVYSLYGFEPLETSAIEYVDALGKYLPESDLPNEGIFALRDDDSQWISLRYDLTAPLARVVAEHKDLPKPFRRYQYGPVWRREQKPGEDRFREFYQCDFDTVGAASMAADAEVCAVLSQALKALGIDDFVVRVNDRKILTGIMEKAQIADPIVRLQALRAMDKLDSIGIKGVEQRLTVGRRDQSGDFVEGVGLSAAQAEPILSFLQISEATRAATCKHLDPLVSGTGIGEEGLSELVEIDAMLTALGLPDDTVRFDPSVVRGLEYYTGPVFEAEVTFEVIDKKTGEKKRFGSVAGGGRYDDLVERFTGEKVPATGASIGVDRLLQAVSQLPDAKQSQNLGPVLVTVMDKGRVADYQAMVAELRAAGIRSEMYLGSSGFRAQMKYADKRQSPVTVIAGSDEFDRGEVTLKDMGLGAKLAKEITDNTEWRESQPAQSVAARADLVSAVKRLLDGDAT